MIDAIISAMRNLTMWFNLKDTEVREILALMPEGTVAEKLREPADPDAQAFIDAVATSDDLEVDPDAVVSRGDDGAFVMSWTWVPNEKAGIEPASDEEDHDSIDSPRGILI
ncbi:hypothetical protein QTA58_19595 [Neorhizobium sp. CSC1952]|uniref:hypothetical protein n=1 Tax=Neorhizobium sp. CSC1952 TaxID=2978974 RepID=UPI0025A5266D|nr:hypothetical protein [Rhizobium sp. CSC1952]WJR66398.1 hypothetical protein QTA58_19595 [Rhizobium sp. CSC1952]